MSAEVAHLPAAGKNVRGIRDNGSVITSGRSRTSRASCHSSGDRPGRAAHPAAAAAATAGTSAAVSSAAMVPGANGPTRRAIVVSPTLSAHPENVPCRAAMCAMNPACRPAGTMASPGGSKNPPMSRITVVRTASSPAPSRPLATTA
jgi:hypothetical protein